jgi:hypothetical protein
MHYMDYDLNIYMYRIQEMDAPYTADGLDYI